LTIIPYLLILADGLALFLGEALGEADLVASGEGDGSKLGSGRVVSTTTAGGVAAGFSERNLFLSHTK